MFQSCLLLSTCHVMFWFICVVLHLLSSSIIWSLFLHIVNVMNRHAVEVKYFHVILLTDDSTVRSLDRSRSFHNASSVYSSLGSVVSANVCPSEGAAVQTIEEVHHHHITCGFALIASQLHKQIFIFFPLFLIMIRYRLWSLYSCADYH